MVIKYNLINYLNNLFGDDDDEENEEDEPQDENPHLTWRMMKEFDDNLFVGESPQTIAAKIVEVLYDAGEAVQDDKEVIDDGEDKTFDTKEAAEAAGAPAAEKAKKVIFIIVQ